MHNKPPFTPEEMQAMFNGTSSQKYRIIKKDLAVIIQRYLLANPKIREENAEVYEKAVALQSKTVLYDSLKATRE